MPEANTQPTQPVQPVQPAQGQQQENQGGWGMAKSLIVRFMVIYFISSIIRSFIMPGSKPAANSTEPQGSRMIGQNLFEQNLPIDLHFYLAEGSEFDHQSAIFLWKLENIRYGDWGAGPNGDGSFIYSGQFKPSEAQLNNGTIFLHVFIVKAGFSLDPKEEPYSKSFTIHRYTCLNKYRKRMFSRTVNLLTGTSAVHPDLLPKSDSNKTFEILSMWHENITVNLLADWTSWPQGGVPPPLNEHIKFSKSGRHYKPVLWFNEYWNLNSDYMPINSTTPTLNLTLTFSPLSLWKWQLYLSQSVRSRWMSGLLGGNLTADLLGMGEESDEDSDTLKRALVETNPYLLAVTVVVSLLHSVFEFLAFKNDIQFWRSRQSFEGLSVRSVLYGVLCSFIVVLYVMDNEANMMVYFSVWISLAIDLWKIKKVIDIRINRERPLFGFLPRIEFHDKSSYVQSRTKEYDQVAFKYLSWLLFPLLGGYAVYSVLYQEHRGWYSWVLSLLYGFLLTFGFIMMTPQLFINYKLKSVAHLPWRMLTYKALNTFIDDLFAFVIRMPTLYRLGCLRDDVIFFIYLYQRWVYKVDPRRMNEFGTSAEMPSGGPVDVDETGRPIEGAAAPAALASTDAPEAAAVIEGSSAPAAAACDPDGLDEPRLDSTNSRNDVSTAESDAGDELRRRKK